MERKHTPFARLTIRKLFISVVVVPILVLASSLVVQADTPSGGSGSQASPSTAVGTGITYQGQLLVSGSPATGQFDFKFTLYDALTGGNMVGTTQTISSTSVTNGLFTVVLDFGANAFQGSARWLEIQVSGAGQGNYITLTPRQQITATPYALGLSPGSTIIGTVSAGAILTVTNAAPGDSNGGVPAYGIYSSGSKAGVMGITDGSSAHGVVGISTNPSSDGVLGRNEVGGIGVYADSQIAASTGLYARNKDNEGKAAVFSGTVQMIGGSNSFAALNVSSTGTSQPNSFGVYAISQASDGVRGVSNNPQSSGVAGFNSAITVGGNGVYGHSINGIGVQGKSVNGDGVYGFTGGGHDVYAVHAVTTNTAGVAIYGQNQAGGAAALFDGNVTINGQLTCKPNPCNTVAMANPANLSQDVIVHTGVESPDMLNIYSGNATTDSAGMASVELPSYVTAINRDFRYQLTVIGQFAQAIVAQEIQGNHFVIKTDHPNVKVSWQVTGVRNDAWAKDHPMQVEVPSSVGPGR